MNGVSDVRSSCNNASLGTSGAKFLRKQYFGERGLYYLLEAGNNREGHIEGEEAFKTSSQQPLKYYFVSM